MSDLLIVIPVRGGSKRLPGKHTRLLAGRNLLERTQDAIGEADLGAPVLLTTDDEEIAGRGRALGWQAPFLRPAALAGDSAPTLPVLLHALDWWRRDSGRDPELVLLLQTTSPMRSADMLRAAVALLARRDEADAVVGVRRLGLGANRIFPLDAGGFLTPLAPSESAAPLFVPNGTLYLIRSVSLRRHGTLFPPATLPLEMDSVASVDVDTEADWRLAQALLSGQAAPPPR
ncbi:MAG: acylneuraminate cytidylyltransferase family protein [Alphaproteobacteria bacterium]|nr:acylneuraminate cytidylyltransferase family protein [Alphaproteobacteria bacterium]